MSFSAQPDTIPVRLTENSPVAHLEDIDKKMGQVVDMTKSGGELELAEPLDEKTDPDDFSQKKVKVTTCQEYFELKNKGYSAETTYEITMESWFINACVPLKLLKQVKPSRITFLEDATFTKNSLETLPLDLVLILSPEEEAKLKSAKARQLTLKQFIPDIYIEKTEKHQIVLKSKETGTTSINLIAMGDFNTDGIEDVLVYVSHYVSHYVSQGSYRDFKVLVLTKLQELGKIQILNAN